MDNNRQPDTAWAIAALCVMVGYAVAIVVAVYLKARDV